MSSWSPVEHRHYGIAIAFTFSWVIVLNKNLPHNMLFDVQIRPLSQSHMPGPNRALCLFMEVDFKLSLNCCIWWLFPSASYS